VIKPRGWISSTHPSDPGPAPEVQTDLRSVVHEASIIADARGRTTGSSTPRQRRHVESAFAITLAAGLLAWLLLTAPTIPVGAFITSVAAFTGASLIEFEIGPGSAVPTTPVMIVSLFLLPPALVPVAAVLGLFSSSLFQRLHDESRHVRPAVMLSSSFYTVGPSLTFAAAGITAAHLSSWPIFLVAFTAQIACDAFSAWLLNCYRLRLPLRALLTPLGFAYLVDLLLAPLGYGIAFAFPGSVAGLFLLTPLVSLLFILQRDRRRQLDHAILLATHDPLTGLPNRTLFQRRLEEALSGARRVAVLLIDLDRFKEVNDTLGHARGDELLIEMGQRLRASLAHSDLVARLGGDEFALYIEAVDESEIVRRVQPLLISLRRPFSLAGVDVDLEASIGVATPDAPNLGAIDLLRRADIAMYAAKGAHESIAFYSPDLDHHSTQRLALAGRLRRAIDEGQLILHYQPQIELRTGALVGLEALVRWQEPDGTMVPPDDFIWLAERSDLIHPLTRFVLDRAITDAARWYRDGLPLRVAVNLSARNLSEDDLVETIRNLLAERGLPPRYLEVELTETTVMANPGRSAQVMGQLSEFGVLICIDDFGTGHSSLSYLTTLPAHQLKIDRSFISVMETEASAETVVRAILDLAQALGLSVVAEGIETATAADSLRGMGCPTGQGYFYSRPLPLCDLDGWIRDRRTGLVTALTG
jgi:diguanylate cyclase (GGDEF)-like protein